MKALTLHQPWATGMVRGFKTVETRSWSTRHRGPLAIHAGKQASAGLAYDLLGVEPEDLPRGAVLGVVELEACWVMTERDIKAALPRERAWGDWRPGRFAWVTRPIIWFAEPIPAVGKQGLWEWTPPEGWRERERVSSK